MAHNPGHGTAGTPVRIERRDRARPSGRVDGLRLWLGDPIRSLGSGRLAIGLLTALILLLGVYLLVPQQGQLPEQTLASWVEEWGVLGGLCQALGGTDVLHSRLLWGTYALLLVNLLVCMSRRFGPVLRRCRFPERPPRAASFATGRHATTAGLDVIDAARVLRRRGYRVLTSEGSVYGLRGRFAGVGHWIFHVGLLLVLAWGMLLAVRPPPFRGTIGVGEGERFDLHSAAFLSSAGPVLPGLPPLQFRVDRVEARTQAGEVRRFQASVSTPDGEAALVGINRPFRSDSYQVMVHGFGYMPGWAIVDGRGKMRRGAWVKLLPFPLKAEDSFPLGPPESRVHVRLRATEDETAVPDADRVDDSRGLRFDTRVVWRGEQVYQGLLEPGERVTLDDGKEFFFLPEIRRYSLLDVIQEEGHVGIFSAFALMLIGLLIRYTRIRKEVLVQVAGRSLRLFGRSEILESLFEEELSRLEAELLQMTPGSAGSESAA